MALVVPSRFSSLKIVEDDYIPAKLNKVKKEEESKKQNDRPVKKNSKNNKNKSFNSNSQSQSKKKAAAAAAAATVAWEEKSKAPDYVVNTFEADLEQLELEDASSGSVDDKDPIKVSNEPFQVQVGKKQKKNKYPPVYQQPMLNSEPPSPLEIVRSKIVSSPQEDSKPQESPTANELFGAHLMSIVQEKNIEIVDLKSEITTLKEELVRVKSRNRKLCSIIGQGEMKEKAEIIAEVEKLREVQTELTNEVESLHIQVEQLKSSSGKVDAKSKDKKK